MNDMLSKNRQDAIKIFHAGLQAVAPGIAIKNFCRLEDEIFTVADHRYDLSRFRNLFVIGAGKAAASMAKAVEEILGERISAGLITVKYAHLEELKRVKISQAGHPIPDQNGLAGARAIYQLATSADEQTLVVCLISGGGSALLPLPVDGISLEDKQKTTQSLLSCGATIHEINTVRKHLSLLKGGGLARAVYPATLISLILSDVVGDDLDSIASGPCVPDPRTFADCKSIFERYAIINVIPRNVLRHIDAGIAGTVAETPKAGQKFFKRTQNVIVASNFDALLKAKEKAEDLGYHTVLLSSMLEGEARELAATHVAIAREVATHGQPLQRPACLLSGGETTVKILGTGKGGRNQEFALAAAIKMAGMENSTIFSAGTDGSDGPTDAAGAIVDGTTWQRALVAGLDPHLYLEDNDSYHFFASLNDLYKTGPTNTNVMDLRIVLMT
ncbi:glycerate 2-kinase [Desulfuromusa kysingii]|uniref:Glycerate 2-kinase n=1 Tax=Desulfuromusa kysingii TaxID=37625 RepID=A0A1H4DNN7_9BACT|nr:glycerate kinase [Desulfuromusa kysingii]SEA74217.1 glycerate 2-kinase [Desulfuromusa kysingii]